MPEPETFYHVYVDSKVPWYDVPVNAEQFETVPPRWQDPGMDELQRHSEDGRIGGSCLCGDVSFEASEPLFMMNCHCTRCRLSRCAAHATNLFVPGDSFRWSSGEDQIGFYKVPDAERFGSAFCQRCGSLVPRVQSPNMDRVNIPAGCLDTDPGIGPSGHIYVDSMASWFRIEDGLQQWPESVPPT